MAGNRSCGGNWDPRGGPAFAAALRRADMASEEEARGATMSSTIQVEAARIPDRDRLLQVLREHGLDAQAQNEIGIEVPCADGGDELFGYVEGVIMDL